MFVKSRAEVVQSIQDFCAAYTIYFGTPPSLEALRTKIDAIIDEKVEKLFRDQFGDQRIETMILTRECIAEVIAHKQKTDAEEEAKKKQRAKK